MARRVVVLHRALALIMNMHGLCGLRICTVVGRGRGACTRVPTSPDLGGCGPGGWARSLSTQQGMAWWLGIVVHS